MGASLIIFVHYLINANYLVIQNQFKLNWYFSFVQLKLSHMILLKFFGFKLFFYHQLFDTD